MDQSEFIRLVSTAFNKLHAQLSMLRGYVEDLEDPVAIRLVESMELGLFAPMRRLRLHLGIPYDLRDHSADNQG